MAISKERVKELEYLANDFFTSNKISNQIVACKPDLYYRLANILYKNFCDIIDKISDDIDNNSFNKKTPLENIELIKEFYKENNIIFDIDLLVKNGSIDFIYEDKENSFWGTNFYEDEHKLIDLLNTGLITDSIVLAHELSHYKNQIDCGRSLTGDLLTEAIAFTEEWVYIDFLKNCGYKEDVIKYLKISYKSILNFSRTVDALFKFCLLFDEVGSLTKESYKFYFGNSDHYEIEFKIVDNFIKEGRSPRVYAEYVIGYSLGFYLYQKYLKNEITITDIQKYHSIINETNFTACFKEFGINDFNEEDFSKIDQNINMVLKRNP